MAKILVVDDEPGIRDLLIEFLGSMGYQMEGASTGKEALEKVKEVAPDLIFLDVKLPDTDGTEVLKEVRAENSTVKVVMVTGNVDSELKRVTEPLGISGFLSKPFDLEKIQELLQKLLNE